MKRNIAYSVLSLIITGLSGFISIPVLTRTLTASDLGHVLLIITILLFISSLDGLRSVVIANYHTYPKEKKGDFIYTTKIMSNILGGGVCVSICFILFYFLNEKISNIEKLFISLSAIVYFPMSFQASIIDSKFGAGYTMLGRALVWMIIYSYLIIMSINHYDIIHLPIIFLCSNFLLWYVFLLKNKSARDVNGSFDLLIFRSIFKQSKNNFYFLIIASIVGVLDKILLFTLKPIEKLAIYTPNHEIATKPNSIIAVVSRLLLPYLAKKKSSRNNIEHEWLYIFKIILIFSLLLSWGVNFFSLEIIAMYAGNSYTDTHMILKLISLGAFLNVYGILSVVLLNSFLDFSTQSTSYTISFLVGIIFGYALIENYSITGAAILYVILRIGDLAIFYLAWTKTLGQLFIYPLILFIFSLGTHMLIYFGHNTLSVFVLIILTYSILKFKIKERLK